ncbi:hypothetical protein Dvina_45085 [Dactylosporangium vinaceum]|uniref:Uncharacterized protein n=1 Tax=Dactylosporangium vinaceum TaxID=53362 RepID=A0ABV5MIK9_9ACTN|nr:hypothetical protein [Dactylosporangium vinaceum]UAB95150.1 hypothetical protein Dvina_45085 [Dactylosporangium vinaceum]
MAVDEAWLYTTVARRDHEVQGTKTQTTPVDVPGDYFSAWAEEVDLYEREQIEHYLTLARDDQGDADPMAIDMHGTPADTLRCAAQYLDSYGWTQHDRYRNLGDLFPAADITGAIRTVVYGTPMLSDILTGVLGWHVDMAIATLADHLGLTTPDMHLLGWLAYSSHAITCWNDETGRTAGQAVAALRAAADAYDATYRGYDTAEDTGNTKES